ncbi:hypothetical protein, partial [Cylindrospermopsis raciborskii]|uniref:hypothetical protein n=1 Tax=Cylindrospermopsis raciborskii TaxID=77022 RepID=UPI003879C641
EKLISTLLIFDIPLRERAIAIYLLLQHRRIFPIFGNYTGSPISFKRGYLFTHAPIFFQW